MPQGLNSPSPAPGPADSGAGSSAGKQIEDVHIEVSPAGPQPNPPPAVDTHIDCILSQQGSSKGARLHGDRIVLDEFAGPFCIRLKLKGWLKWRDGDPLWITRDNCPSRAAVDHEQIWLDKNPKNDTIVLLDMNVGDACTLHYRMNFQGNVHCDPIMDNGGGGTIARF
jgi:hypothetical protein